ncbi:efflux RND transporter periplasmic adaptor subunit [bacterium]|nr:efflux RND transporter periplasmic adaptor subunit [bacterium]
MSSKSKWILVVVSVALSCAWLWLQKKSVAPTQTVCITKQSITAFIVEKGRIQSDSERTITAKSVGIVKEILVREGDWVNAGRPLVVMDTSLSLQKLKEAQSNQQITGLEQTKASENVRLQQLLFVSGAASKADVDNAEHQFKLAKTNHEISLAKTEMARTEFNHQQYIADKRLQIAKISVEEGSVVSPETVLMQLIDPTHLKVDIRVKEFDAPSIKLGQIAWITAANSRQRLSGKVARIQPILEKIGDTYSMKVTICISSQNINLKPGSQVDVRIITGESAHVWALPLSAVLYENGGYKVKVNTKSGKPYFKSIEVGLQDINFIEVTHGLSPNDQVQIL